MQDLRIKLIQARLEWESPEQNFTHLGEMARSGNPADVIVLPEMFSTGFSMDPERVAEPQPGPGFKWMAELAKATNSLILGSLAVKENGLYFNRMYAMSPQGLLGKYDKRHLFRMANEHDHYSPGRDKTIVEWKGWKILLQVCYDLRFPVFSRNMLKAGEGYDCCVFVANWPEKRSHHWRTLLKARAIENQAYVIGVNRVAEDGNQIVYRGDSAIIDPLGRILTGSAWEETVLEGVLSAADLASYRQKFPAWQDAD